MKCSYCDEVKDEISDSSMMCEDCQNDYDYCSICDAWQNREGAHCEHVWWSRARGLLVGPGSDEGEHLFHHIIDFRWIVNRLGVGAPEAIVKALEGGDERNYHFLHATGGLGPSFCTWKLPDYEDFGSNVARLQYEEGAEDHADGMDWLLSLDLKATEARAETIAELEKVTNTEYVVKASEVIDGLPAPMRELLERSARAKVLRSTFGDNWKWEDDWIRRRLDEARWSIVAVMLEKGLASAGEDFNVAADRLMPPPWCRVDRHDQIRVVMMVEKAIEARL